MGRVEAQNTLILSTRANGFSHANSSACLEFYLIRFWSFTISFITMLNKSFFHSFSECRGLSLSGLSHNGHY